MAEPLGVPKSRPAHRCGVPSPADRRPRSEDSLDITTTDLDEAAAELTALGAQAGRRWPNWYALQTPGGLPICLIGEKAFILPAPHATADGNRLRLVQVCLDIPPPRTSAEVDFWRATSGWRWVPSADQAFLGKLHHDGASPVQLLLQRLGEDDPALRTRAHLDLGADDIDRAADRLVGLGAVRGAVGDGWIVLTDPVGMEFCVTGNSPD